MPFEVTNESCLVVKFAHYLDLTAGERRSLARLEEAERDFRRREVLIERGAEITDIFAVKSGWIYGHSTNPDGSEFVAELHFPGDFVGVSQIGFARSPLAYTAATDTALCPFPKMAMREMLREHPRLAALVFSLATIEHVAAIDRLRALGRMSARDGLAIFLLQVRSRLRIVERSNPDNGFEIPLSQEMIGNVVGLSMVSVNRAFRQLEDENVIRRDGRRVTFVDPARLAEEVDFDDRHYAIDRSWFPLPMPDDGL